MTKKDERILISDRCEVISHYDQYSRDELIEEMDLHINNLDEELRASVKFEIDTESHPYDTSNYPKLFMTWKRPETDKEMKARLAQTKQYEQMRIEHERREFERLQKIYGKKK